MGTSWDAPLEGQVSKGVRAAKAERLDEKLLATLPRRALPTWDPSLSGGGASRALGGQAAPPKVMTTSVHGRCHMSPLRDGFTPR